MGTETNLCVNSVECLMVKGARGWTWWKKCLKIYIYIYICLLILQGKRVWPIYTDVFNSSNMCSKVSSSKQSVFQIAAKCAIVCTARGPCKLLPTGLLGAAVSLFLGLHYSDAAVPVCCEHYVSISHLGHGPASHR